MVNFGQEVSSWRCVGEIGGEDEFELEVAGVVGCLFGSFDFSLCLVV